MIFLRKFKTASKAMALFSESEVKKMVKMTTMDAIFGVILLVICLVIVILTLLQGKRVQNMTGAIQGGANESHFSKNEGRTKEAILNKVTAVLLAVLFIGTLATTIVETYRIGE